MRAKLLLIAVIASLSGLGVFQLSTPNVPARPSSAVQAVIQAQPANPPPTQPTTVAADPVQPTPEPTPAPTVPVNTYPANLANAPLDTIVDPFFMYNRECTSYVAWKVQEAFGNMPVWNYTTPDAARWPALALSSGFQTGSTPKVHSAAVAPSTGLHGHVSWVEAVRPDGLILVSQYNADGQGNFSYDTIYIYGLIFIYFGG